MNNKLPKWIDPDSGTIEQDKEAPSAAYLDGIKHANEWRYPFIAKDPDKHKYNVDTFRQSLKSVREKLRWSDNVKSDFNPNLTHLKMDEFNFWAHAPLQVLADSVGDRLIPGMFAQAKVNNDYFVYNEFKEWFEKVWLPQADRRAKEAVELGRYYTRTNQMTHFYRPLIDSIASRLDGLLEENVILGGAV